MRSMGFGGLYPGMVGMSRGRHKSGGTYTTDATSGIAIPQNATEWAAFLSAKGLSNWSTPDDLWLCQDSASPLADAVGSITLAASGTTLGYRQAVTGWSSKQVTTASNSNFFSTSASLPDISTTSQLLLAFAVPPASVSANTDWFTFGSSAGVWGLITSAGKPEVLSGLTTSALGSVVTGRSWVPVVLQHNATGHQDGLFTDVDKLLPTWTASSSQKGVYFGHSHAGNTATAGVIYAAQWIGAKAERTTADIKALLQAVGVTVTWV